VLTGNTGPGLAIRITGPVDGEKLKIARQADSIFIEEIRKAGLYDEISKLTTADFDGSANTIRQVKPTLLSLARPSP
jgi:GMP synthase PP-ATPase subunit